MLNILFYITNVFKKKRVWFMKNIVVITGTSSGIGALAARALAQKGHIVYASMRETTGRNESRK
jgi:NADP-dependent 3-hydroxy acid dehydrogenase YdfG